MTRFVLVVLVGAVAAAPGAAHASGFALREFSGSAQGNAHAGATASAEDVSYMAFNPAGITRHRGSNFAVNVTAIVPRSEFTSSGADTLGTPIEGGNGGSDGAPDHLVPALFYAHEITPRLFGGVSFTAPFGLATDYDSGWVGRYHALETDLKTLDMNPVLAYKLTPALSVGGGIRVAYTRGVMSNAVDFGTIGAVLSVPDSTPTQNDGIVEIEGDDIALGFNLGVLYDLAPGTRVGLAYRSKLHNQLEGAANFNNSATGNTIAGLTGQFTHSGIRTELNLPETISAGIHHDFDARLAIMAEVAWTRWERLEELRVHFDNPAQADSVIPEHWRNTWFVAVGTTYRANDHWTFRAGLAYDQSPVPDATRTPRIPDEDRAWLSLGVSYNFSPDLGFDIGYTHMFLDKAAIRLSESEPANAFRGNLNGNFSIAADILAAQFRMRF